MAVEIRRLARAPGEGREGARPDPQAKWGGELPPAQGGCGTDTERTALTRIGHKTYLGASRSIEFRDTGMQTKGRALAIKEFETVHAR